MSSSQASAVPRPIDIALIVLLAALWGSSYSFVKIALDTVTPLTLAAFRVLAAAIVLSAIVALRRRAIPRHGRYWRDLVLQSAINVVIPFSAYAWAQQFVPSALAGIMNSSTPIFVFLITAFWTRHERADAERLFGTLVGLFGVGAIVGLDALTGLGAHVLAELAMLVGTLGYALSAVHGRRFQGVAPDVTAAGTLAFAALIMLPLAFMFERPLSLEPGAGVLASILYLGVFCTAGTFVIYFHLVDRVGSMNTVSASYLRAGFAVLFGMLILSEAFTWSIALGLTGVVVGVAAINGHLARARRWLRFRRASPGAG